MVHTPTAAEARAIASHVGVLASPSRAETGKRPQVRGRQHSTLRWPGRRKLRPISDDVAAMAIAGDRYPGPLRPDRMRELPCAQCRYLEAATAVKVLDVAVVADKGEWRPREAFLCYLAEVAVGGFWAKAIAVACARR